MPHKLTDYLTVTDDQYDAARAAADARGLSLTRGWFLDPQAWTVVPDGAGRPSKAELCLNKPAGLLPGRTMLNLWLAPDIRRPGMAWPHGHPADFVSEIVYGGGYTEMRYGRNASGVWSAECTYRRGDRNRLGVDDFHEIPDVAPGSLSVMEWGPDPVFLAFLAALNPQHPNRWR